MPHTLTRWKLESDHQPLSLCTMGSGYYWTISSGYRKKKIVLVAIDYFMKWVEVKALANIGDVDVKRFVWKNIVTRFGVPRTLVSGNGLQFDSKAF